MAGTKKPNYGRVVNICTNTAQKELIGPALLAIAAPFSVGFLLGPYALGGFLAGMILVGQLLAVFMANAGGAWDNAKKIVEVELQAKGTELHAATVVGDTVGDPFKDTSSVAMNPVIKFTTLFGLLAVELAVSLSHAAPTLGHFLAGGFFVVSFIFVYRSFYSMRIKVSPGTREEEKVGAHAD